MCETYNTIPYLNLSPERSLNHSGSIKNCINALIERYYKDNLYSYLYKSPPFNNGQMTNCLISRKNFFVSND